MASSNRHWPSMFKSKPSNHPHFSSNPSGGEGEIRTPEPKPRWNPKPEQIRILEAIFNSGMVTPPRDEIRKIRARLQEYGQVGDANVFYWFQNRKSRSKNKLRHLKPPPTSTTRATSSSSSDKSSPLYLSNEPLLHSSSQGFSDQECVVVGDDHELMLMNHGPLRSKDHDHKVDHKLMKLPQQQIITPTQPIVPRNILPELGETAPPKMRVFINDVCYEVGSTVPFNVREAFGDGAVLMQPSGCPVLTHQSGLTHHPLQNGAFYYLIHHLV